MVTLNYHHHDVLNEQSKSALSELFPSSIDDLPFDLAQQARALAARDDLVALVKSLDGVALLAARVALLEGTAAQRQELVAALALLAADDNVVGAARELVIRALYASRDPSLMNATLKQLFSPQVATRAGAARALSFTHDPVAIAPLLSVIAAGDVTAPVAVMAIGTIGVPHPLAERVLLDALRCGFCVNESLLALGKMGRVAVFAQLLTQAHRHPRIALKACVLLSQRCSLSELPELDKKRARDHIKIMRQRLPERHEQLLLSILELKLATPSGERGSL